MSADYVALIRQALPDVEVVNAGVNLELSSGLVSRLGALTEHQPDVACVLTGTNNVRYALDEHDAERLRRRWQLTDTPSPASYRDDLRTIAGRLRETGARVALSSLPVIGEVLDSEPVRRAAEYSSVVREVAAEQQVGYLPLHERMVAFLERHPAVPATRFRPGRYLVTTAALQNFLLRRSFDAISRSRGLQLTTDTIHLNGRGAAMLAELAIAWCGSMAPGIMAEDAKSRASRRASAT
ncbi:MAG: SGNH/GDSL hydrolase family protein [Deltaproteobacteria bacterium]|nr:SGNH/GDSL hydrolase family protein [Nannocystaceae bacterium]